MSKKNQIAIKDIAGGLLVIVLMVVAAFVFMSVFSFAWDQLRIFLRWVDNPILTIVILVGSVIFAGIFFSFAKIAEHGFNIRRVLNDILHHFRRK